jgi:hypothetical protein
MYEKNQRWWWSGVGQLIMQESMFWSIKDRVSDIQRAGLTPWLM